VEDQYDTATSPPTFLWKTLKEPFRDGTHVLVMTCDICSSSDIIEDLTSTGSVSRFWEILSEIKHAIPALQEHVFFYPYKFMGDGWIFLFPGRETAGRAQQLWNLMHDFSTRFQKAFNEKLREGLNTQPKVVGINFGLDCGPIFHARFLGQDEYIGRPIGVASRLQGKLKELGGSPAYKALASPVAWADYLKLTKPPYRVTSHNVQLRNVNRDKPFQSCKRITIIPVHQQQPPEHSRSRTR